MSACGGGGGGGGGSSSLAGLGTAADGTSAGTGTVSQATTPSSSTSAGTTTAPAVVGDVVDDSGKVSIPDYRTIASQMNQAAGIAYRYGTGTATAGTSTTYPAAANNAYPATARFTNMTWQLGAYDSNNEGDYSTTMGQVAWLPDSPTQYLGVKTLEFLAQRSNTFSEAPQTSWVFGDSEDLNTKTYYKPMIPAGVQTNPVAMGRCYARLTWCVQSVMAFQSGLIGTSGSNTANNHTTAQLDAGKVPTAVAVTNGGEFALITVWDTVNLKGQIAVVALAGGCQGCGGGSYWGEWTSIVPGLPNLNNIAFMKVIGYVDLPDMITPTEISVTTGLDNETLQRVYLPGSCGSNFVNHEQLPLNVAANRATFTASGCNYGSLAHGGVAVVVSKSEQKVSFVNLKPLFDYYQSMYFGTDADYAKTTTVGQAANQWPFTFDQASTQKPTVIKTVDLGKRPTAVKASLYSTQRAWIATEDGSLQIYSLGNYAFNGSAVPTDIALKGSVAIGKNPTALAYVKHDPAERTDIGTLNNNVLVVSRGDKKLQWVHFNADNNSGSIRRELQDSRLKDPVWAEDADNHGTEAYVLTVADYEGKQALNYRYGPVIFQTNTTSGSACQPPNGCGMSQAFEFGGAFALPGKAYQVTGANVP